MSRLLLLAFLLASIAPARDALAQRSDAAARAALRPEARARAAAADSLLGRPTRALPNGRADAASGALRAAYRVRTTVPAGLAPEEAARAYLAARRADFGLPGRGEPLRLLEVRRSPAGAHVRFQQQFSGLPVYNRYVRVSLDRRNQPTIAFSGFAPHLAAVASFDPAPSIGPAAARRAAEGVLAGAAASTGEPELVVYPEDPPRLAWRVVVRPAGLPAEWELLLDARTGALILAVELGASRADGDAAPGGGRVGPQEGGHVGPQEGGHVGPQEGGHVGPQEGGHVGPPLRDAAPPESRIPNPAYLIDGSGLVFDPDPLSTAGRPYGGAYVDAGDADVPELNAQRVEVTLRGLDPPGTDGRYRLTGPFVRVVAVNEFGSPVEDLLPAEQDPHAFRYGRADPRFEAVMAYYHVDESQRYVQSLGFVNVQNNPIRVSPYGYGDRDDSRYFPSSNVILFGTGGVDDAEDADVIWHEYAHALLEGAAPGLLGGGGHGRALHEGWADYWAGSYSRFLEESGQVVGTSPEPDDWRLLYSWDGNNAEAGWFGRRIEHGGRYPDDLTCTGSNPSPGCIYTDGLLWATTLMEIYPTVGRNVLDRLLLQSHFYLNPGVTFRDAAEALLQADAELYGGAHFGALVDRLAARGFVDPAQFGPVLVHTPAGDVERLGGSLPIEADATGTFSPVDRVLLYFDTGGGWQPPVPLTPAGDGRYAGGLPLPDAPALVRYYLEAVDQGGRRTVLPAGAPGEVYAFQAGPDDEPPVIEHTPVDRFSLVAWPAELSVRVEDNLGVDSVWATFEILDAGSETARETGAFGLAFAEGAYRGFFPVGIERMRPGDRVRYRIHARDRAAQPNLAQLPAGAAFEFEVQSTGIVRRYDFEGSVPALQASGVFQRGRPAYGLRTAHSGDFVWATVPGGPYPATAGLSTLELPPLNTSILGQAYLVFWHWYDAETGGDAVPPGGAATLWDGGNVKLSLDGGATWLLVEPEDGYPGRIQPGENPLAGQRAFGGYSYGWRREIVPLPAAPDVRVRFEFGTDGDNSDPSAHGYAGWHLDDLVVTTQRPVDETPPTLLTAPPLREERPVLAVQPEPVIAARLTDDTGIDRVEAAYEMRVGGATSSGTLRLAMDPSDPLRFAATLPATAPFEPGDFFTYRLVARDFAGNAIVYPDAAGAPARVDYRLVETAAALLEARPSGSWAAQASGWSVEPGREAARSALVLAPVDLPENAARLEFALRHFYRLDPDAGGNVKLSLDGGATWRPIEPLGGYPERLEADGHPMDGEPVFSGAGGLGEGEAIFDLSPHAGRQVRLRLDFGAPRALREDEFWVVWDASYSFSTGQPAFEIPRTLALHPNFPDPFGVSTTIGFTLPETLPVRLEVYDLLGRRVEMLVDEERPAGSYTVTFDAARLPDGLYFLRLTAGAAQIVERMMKAGR